MAVPYQPAVTTIFTVDISITGTGSGASSSGSAQSSIPLSAGISSRSDVIAVPVARTGGGPGPGPGGNAILKLSFDTIVRDAPVCYRMDWLCQTRNTIPVVMGWLCQGTGFTVSPDGPAFSGLQSVIELDALLKKHMPGLNWLNSQLSLGYSPTGPDMMGQADYATSITLAAAPQAMSLSLSQAHGLSGFYQDFTTKIGNYAGEVYHRLPQPEPTLCAAWQTLLNCFCRFCTTMSDYPSQDVDLWTNQAAGVVHDAYQEFVLIAAAEGMAYAINPNITDICGKLAELVGFWAWWCRNCPRLQITWGSTVQPYYDSLYSIASQMSFWDEADQFDFCEPLAKGLCERWFAGLGCIERLCDRMDYLPGTVLTTLENSFGAILYAALYGVEYNQTSSQGTSFCFQIERLKLYLGLVCSSGSILGDDRREELETLIGQLEDAYGSFPYRNLCAEVDCAEWSRILSCLNRICQRKSELSLNDAIWLSDHFAEIVDDLYYAVESLMTPATPPSSGGNGLELMCWKLDRIGGYVEAICCSGEPFDPVLNARLSMFQSAFADLNLHAPGICADCDRWLPMLECLGAICDNKGMVPPDLAESIAELFSPPIHAIYTWLPDDGSNEVAPPLEPLGLDPLCWRLQKVLAWFNDLCAGTEVMDPVLRQNLEAAHFTLTVAFDALGEVEKWRNICDQTSAVSGELCARWVPLLACLHAACGNALLPSAMRDAILAEFGEIIDLLDWLLGTPDGYYEPPIEISMSDFCMKLARVQQKIHQICSNQIAVHPILLLRLEHELEHALPAFNTLLAAYPSICAGEEFCHDWMRILECLSRLCGQQNLLGGDLIARLITNFGKIIHDAYRRVMGQEPEVIPGYTIEILCSDASALLEWFVDYCGCGVGITAGLRDDLSVYLAQLQLAYDGLHPCKSDCATTSVDLTTGTQPGGYKVDWIITDTSLAISLPRPAIDIDGPSAPYQGSAWVFAVGDDVQVPDGMTILDRYFCLRDAADITVDLLFQASDPVLIWINDQLLVDLLDEGSIVRQTVHLAAGRHRVRVKVVHAVPGYHKGFNAQGSITTSLPALVRDECCDAMGASVPGTLLKKLCCDSWIDCGRLYEFSALARILCGASREPNDPFFDLPSIGVANTLMVDFEATTLQDLLVLLEINGNPPLGIEPVGTGFCDRLRFILQNLIFAYSNPALLTPLLRYRIECFYTRLLDGIAADAELLIDPPADCSPCEDICLRWLDLLRCLCALCADEESVAIGLFETLVCGANGLYNYLYPGGSAVPVPVYPVPYPPEAPVTCCDIVRRTYTFFALLCLECGSVPADMAAELELRYADFHAQLQVLRATSQGTAPDLCYDRCGYWQPKLECLMNLCLRVPDLPSDVRDAFGDLLSRHVRPLFDLLRGEASFDNPFEPHVIGDTCWQLFQICRMMHLHCSPLNLWSRDLMQEIDGFRHAFDADYAVVMSLLGTKDIPACYFRDRSCEVLQAIPDFYRLFCSDVPDLQHMPVRQLDTLTAGHGLEIRMLQYHTGAPNTAYQTAGGFCQRFGSFLGILAAAFGHYGQLAPAYRLAADLLYTAVDILAAEYRMLVPERVVPASTAMSRYRDTWLDLLGCLCAICGYVKGLSDQEKETQENQEILSYFDPVSALMMAVDELYDGIVPLAAQHDLPLPSGICVAGDGCTRVGGAMSFFSMLGLSSADVPADLVALLKSILKDLREEIAPLRGYLASIGRDLCRQENPDFVAVQSSHLYIQAAGSTGADGSSPGIHLRWSLLGEDLGERHLPKGNLASPGSEYYGANGYNKAGDFVRIYRTPYKQKFAAIIDLNETMPVAVIPGNAYTPWRLDYHDILTDPLFPDSGTTVGLLLLDPYAGSIEIPEPGSPDFTEYVQDIFATYNGAFELDTPLKLIFGFEVIPPHSATGISTQFEAISHIGDPSLHSTDILTCRKTIAEGDKPHKIYSEHIRSVRFKPVNYKPVQLIVETYHDYHTAIKRRFLWEHIGDFGLSTDTGEVFRRLEDAPRYVVHNRWPKYSSSDSSSNEATPQKVNVDTYKDRWSPNREFLPNGDPNPGYDPARPDYLRDPQQSLRWAIETYLDESRDPAKLEAWIDQPSLGDGDQSYISISLLAMLRFAAQDYHVARMLGLGHIDWEVPMQQDSSEQQYVYLAEYITLPNSTMPNSMIHRSLSLPTGRSDHRLPVTPEILNLEPGLASDLTDEQGYTRFGDSRFIKVNRKDLMFDLPAVTEFFAGTEEFSRGDNTRPVFYGVKFSVKDPADPTVWMIDPSNDAGENPPIGYRPYKDPAGEPEIIPVPDTGNPLFIHRIERREEHTGVHRYGMYGINWFSRASAVSESTNTVENTFPVRNTLLPPLNLTAQYIQKEQALMFTSAAEQNPVNGLLGKSRVTFDWNHIHTIAYQEAEYVDFYFRNTAPEMIKGRVKYVESALDGATARVTLEAYQESQGTIIDPNDPDKPVFQNPDRFVGGMFVTDQRKYIVADIILVLSGPAAPVAVFELQGVMEATPDGPPGAMLPVLPVAGTIVVIQENASASSRWTALPENRIKLARFNIAPYASGTSGSPTALYSESIRENDRYVRYAMGGLADPAVSVQRDSTPGMLENIFTLTFSSAVLYPYSAQFPEYSNVDFYKGTARVHLPDEGVRQVEVLKIHSYDPLVLYVYDPEGEIAPQNGSVIRSVNFHPSYRVYLDLGADGITTDDIEPQGGAQTRTTLLAARSVDTTTCAGAIFRSPLATAPHSARLMIEAKTPNDPVGPEFATRPDYYGKSTYTFDTRIALRPVMEPYGMMFYRCDEQAVLAALYTSATIAEIGAALAGREGEASYADRWRGLVNGTLVGGAFEIFDGYGFPLPDNPDTFIPTPANPSTLRYPFLSGTPTAEDIRDVIDTVFLPLTEYPVIVGLVGIDDTLRTSSKKPVIRKDDPMFDPYPMIRVGDPGDGRTVRFTDFTLDGASNNIYFYYTREMSNEMVFGERSTIVGPVRLINSMPPAAPAITRIAGQSPNPLLDLQAQVSFEIVPYPPGERIEKLGVYRALSEVDTRSLALMRHVGDMDIPPVGTIQQRYTVVDRFQNEAIPFGRLLYYRIVAYRRILNEEGNVEHVMSLPSDVIMTNIVDTVSPVAPAIIVSDPLPVTGDAISGLVLAWSPTTYQGTYALYMMTSGGNWMKLKDYAPDDELAYDWAEENPDNATLPAFRNGSRVYHRFKVMVKNSSGLVNLEDTVKLVHAP